MSQNEIKVMKTGRKNKLKMKFDKVPLP